MQALLRVLQLLLEILCIILAMELELLCLELEELRPWIGWLSRLRLAIWIILMQQRWNQECIIWLRTWKIRKKHWVLVWVKDKSKILIKRFKRWVQDLNLWMMKDLLHSNSGIVLKDRFQMSYWLLLECILDNFQSWLHMQMNWLERRLQRSVGLWNWKKLIWNLAMMFWRF